MWNDDTGQACTYLDGHYYSEVGFLPIFREIRKRLQKDKSAILKTYYVLVLCRVDYQKQETISY